MAAVLAGGLDACLSHRSAAALWGIRPGGGASEVTAAGWKPARSGIVFRSSSVPCDERTTRLGIPVTTVPRTILDLARFLDDDQLERVLRETERLRLTDAYSVADLLDRYPRRRGAGTLRRISAIAELYSGVTRSELEERFRGFIARHGLPAPEWNARLELDGMAVEVDCVWRDQRVAVELDGYGYHAQRDAFERDRLRDRLLHLAGWLPVRITWKALRDDRRVAGDLARFLGVDAAGRPAT